MAQRTEGVRFKAPPKRGGSPAERPPGQRSGRSSGRAADERESAVVRPERNARYSGHEAADYSAAKQGGTTGQSVLREGLARLLFREQKSEYKVQIDY